MDGAVSVPAQETQEMADHGSSGRTTLLPAELPATLRRISPASALPTITAAGTVIDGTTQTTNQGNTNSRGPEIEISGAGAGADIAGLTVAGGTFTLRGLVVNSFTANGNLFIAFASNYAVSTGPTTPGGGSRRTRRCDSERPRHYHPAGVALGRWAEYMKPCMVRATCIELLFAQPNVLWSRVYARWAE